YKHAAAWRRGTLYWDFGDLFGGLPNHEFRCFKISNYTVFQRTNGFDIVMGFSLHMFGFFPDSDNFIGASVYCNDRRTVYNYLVVVYNKCIGSTQIDSYLLCKKIK